MTEETFKDICLCGETTKVQFKLEFTSTSQKEIAKEMIAFVNTKGGSILLGLNSIEVGKLLHLMVEKGLLNQNNKNRRTTYTILKKLDFENGEEKSKEKREVQLSPIESSVLQLLHQNPCHTYETLKQSLGCSETYIYKVLNQLKKKKVIRREGGRKSGFWVVIDSEEIKENE